MASSIDFIGKDCPLCGAVDSLDIDDARGEVACTECAAVIAMGLEENALTRFEKDATMLDVDRNSKDDRGGDPTMERTMALEQSHMLSRTEAAALAAGIVGPVNAEKKMYDKYMKTHLAPGTTRFIEDLVGLSRRNHGQTISRKAIELAKLFLGRRKELGVDTPGERETAAACVVLASGLDRQPIPSAELHMLNHSLRHVEQRRLEILKESTISEQDKRRLSEHFVPDLVRHYIRLLNLQFNRYELACVTLARDLKTVSDQQRVLQNLSEAERVVAAVLLARSEKLIQWDAKPPYDAATEPQLMTLYDGFAAAAHLDAARVRSVMKTVQSALPEIAATFAKSMSSVKAEAVPSIKLENAAEAVGTKRPRQP